MGAVKSLKINGEPVSISGEDYLCFREAPKRLSVVGLTGSCSFEIHTVRLHHTHGKQHTHEVLESGLGPAKYGQAR